MRLFSPSSLRWRLTVRVISVQVAVIVVLGAAQLLTEAYLWSSGRLYDGNNGWTAVNTVAESVSRAADGTLKMDPSPTLRERLQDPGFWYVVRDTTGQQISHGTPPASVSSALDALDAIAYADLGQDLEKSDVPVATVQWALSSAGQIKVMTVARTPVTFVEALTLASTKNMVTVMFLSLLIILTLPLITPWVVKRTLATLNRAAAEAKAINFKHRGSRLNAVGVPSEARPFIDAVNGAFSRLDEGYTSHQRFLADAAHELRTPIAILSTRLSSLPGSAQKSRLQADVARLTNLANQLLDLQRYEQGSLALEPVNLVELAETVVGDIAPLAVSAGYDISLEAEVADLWISADALSIGRAVGNLVQNAINHGGQSGAITVRVGASANIDVIDEGPGIAQSERERVFEPFHRLKNDGRGVGLGLDVVQRIMHAHGGHAELVEGAMSSGAHFRLRFESARTAPATA